MPSDSTSPEEMSELGLDDSFSFACDPDVSCFNACCRDLNQFLTPYDVLRLARHLGMASGEFLGRYTAVHTGPQTGLPVVTLKPGDNVFLICPFVSEAGCRVYSDRPASCRIYPLIRVLARSRETGETYARYMLLKEPHCKGFDRGTPQTVRQWMADQGLSPYNRMNDALMSVIALKNQMLEGPLPKPLADFFYAACYDLDGFRGQLKAGDTDMTDTALEAPDPETAADEVLLQFSLDRLAERIRHAAAEVTDGA